VSAPRTTRIGAGLLTAALVTSLMNLPGGAAQAAPKPGPTSFAAVAAAPGSAAALTVDEPTNLAEPEEKVKAAVAIGVNPDANMLLLNDQAFVLALWRESTPGSYVQAEALRAYTDDDPAAAYAFILTGVFTAVADDAAVEIAAESAKARRRSVAVTVGLDPKDTELIEKGDRDFIFSIWQRAEPGSHVWTAARDAVADGTGPAEWDVFLNTGAQSAAEQDLREAIDKADEEQAAKLRAEQLLTAKRALLQLLLLPVTEELVNAPNRQYVLNVHNTAKGAEVQLASQVALNAPDAELAQALSDFIFTGGAAANKRDEDAAAAKELAGYRERVIPIRDAAKHDGFAPALVAAAEKALADNTLVALQTFLIKGQDEARAQDRRLDLGSGFETADTRPNFEDAVDATGTGHGGSAGVGGIVASVTAPELGVRAQAVAHAGGKVLMYSGKDNSDTKSYAYQKVFSLSNATVRPTSTLSYWIYPQSSASFAQVVGNNSTCVAVDMIFGDGSTLRDSAATDQHGNRVHPAQQCGKLTPDTWNEVVVPLGAVAAGKKVARVTVGYDQPAGTGGYRGFIDDLKVADLDSSPKLRTSAETGETKLSWTSTADSGVAPRGGLANVGGFCCSLTGPELKPGPAKARSGSQVFLYSGKDASTTSSYAYMKAFGLTDTFVTASTTVSYWIYPQSTTGHAQVAGKNSTCVALDLVLTDQITGTASNLRDSGATDQKGVKAHPASQCTKVTTDTWNFVSVKLGGVANGKQINQVSIGYDQKANTGGYRGFIDDIRVTQ
jgi:hypothetical protein